MRVAAAGCLPHRDQIVGARQPRLERRDVAHGQLDVPVRGAEQVVAAQVGAALDPDRALGAVVAHDVVLERGRQLAALGADAIGEPAERGLGVRIVGVVEQQHAPGGVGPAAAAVLERVQLVEVRQPDRRQLEARRGGRLRSRRDPRDHRVHRPVAELLALLARIELVEGARLRERDLDRLDHSRRARPRQGRLHQRHRHRHEPRHDRDPRPHAGLLAFTSIRRRDPRGSDSGVYSVATVADWKLLAGTSAARP